MHRIQAIHVRRLRKKERPLGCHVGGLTEHGHYDVMQRSTVQREEENEEGRLDSLVERWYRHERIWAG